MTNNAQKYDRTSYILVVDDDNTLLKFFKIHLNKFFSKVIVVKNAKEAIASLREKDIDLVITDINMPRMDGLQLLKRVRKYDTAIPVLLISGALLRPEEETLVAEADGYLRKPFDVDQLHDFIKTGLDRREKLKKLSMLIADKKHLRNLLQKKTSVEKIVSKEHQAKVQALICDLQASSAPASTDKLTPVDS